MDKRKTSLEKYNISRKRYKELCGFVEQYPEWLNALKELEPSLSAQNLDGMPHGTGTSDTVAALASKRAAISKKIDLIDKTLRDASPEYHDMLLDNIVYGAPFYYLKNVKGIPMSAQAFYDRRRYFFYLLSQRRE